MLFYKQDKRSIHMILRKDTKVVNGRARNLLIVYLTLRTIFWTKENPKYKFLVIFSHIVFLLCSGTHLLQSCLAFLLGFRLRIFYCLNLRGLIFPCYSEGKQWTLNYCIGILDFKILMHFLSNISLYIFFLFETLKWMYAFSCKIISIVKILFYNRHIHKSWFCQRIV